MIRRVIQEIPKPLLVILVCGGVIIGCTLLYINLELRRAAKYKEEVVYYRARSSHFGDYIAIGAPAVTQEAATGVIIIPVPDDENLNEGARYAINYVNYQEPGEYRYFRYSEGERERFIIIKDMTVVADGIVPDPDPYGLWDEESLQESSDTVPPGETEPL